MTSWSPSWSHPLQQVPLAAASASSQAPYWQSPPHQAHHVAVGRPVARAAPQSRPVGLGAREVSSSPGPAAPRVIRLASAPQDLLHSYATANARQRFAFGGQHGGQQPRGGMQGSTTPSRCPSHVPIVPQAHVVSEPASMQQPSWANACRGLAAPTVPTPPGSAALPGTPTRPVPSWQPSWRPVTSRANSSASI